MKNVPWKKLSSCPAKSRETLRTTSVSIVRMTVARKAARKPQRMKKWATPLRGGPSPQSHLCRSIEAGRPS